MAHRSTDNRQITDDRDVKLHGDGNAFVAGGSASDTGGLPASGFVTVAWVKRRYALPNSTLYSWIAASRFPATVRIGLRSVRFRVEDLAAFEASLGTDKLVIKATSK